MTRAAAMYAGPIPFCAIASAWPTEMTERSAARSRFWSNQLANMTFAQPLVGSSA